MFSVIAPRLSVCLALSLLAVGANELAASETIELNNFTLIDATGGAARHVDRLIARDGRIVAIDALGEVPSAEPDSVWSKLDLAGAWVMPGLIDTHVHVARFPDTRTRAADILQRAVRGGVTTVRDLTGDARALAELERAIAAEELIGPNLVYSALFGGPDIFKEGPMASMVGRRRPGTTPWSRSIDASSDLPRLVAEASGTGARNVKVYGDLSAALATALIRESTRQGLATTAHATVFPAGPGDLVEAGVGSLSHAPYLVWQAVDEIPGDYRKRTAGPWNEIAPDHPRLLALYRRMSERGVSLDATLYVYKTMSSYPGVGAMDWTEPAFKWGAAATRHAQAAGVLVTTGTDWFEPSDDNDLPHTHAELALLVEHSGFTAMQAVIAGTRNGAIALGLGDTLGTIEPGKQADMLVLDGDPLADIRNTTRIRYTLSRGRIVKPF